tara:strand:+ start:429 stop:635 length:207 start_codon:yes stop_codon:yes gene_type:complete
MKINLDNLPQLLEYCKELTKQLEQARQQSSDKWEKFETDYPFLNHLIDSTVFNATCLDIENAYNNMIK